MTVVLAMARRELLGALKDKDVASAPAWKRHAFRATVCMAALILWPIALADWLREKPKFLWDELRKKARQKREGLRKRQDYDIVVDAPAWHPGFNNSPWTRWVEGEIRELLPGDTALKWGWQEGPLCGQGGYAIERNGRIVAECIRWVS
jgi:hypothetical protein